MNKQNETYNFYRQTCLSLLFNYNVSIDSVQHRDLENCLDLAIRKEKAAGEAKPTERRWTITYVTVG